MKRRSKLTRRKFIQIAATAAAAGPIISCSQASSPWRVLTVSEAQLLAEICAQIVPADQDAGAKEANVVNFIDKQLLGPYKRHRRAYRDGLVGVDQTSRAMHGKPFAELAAENQIAVLKALEKNEAPGDVWTKRSPKAFFDMVVLHTMQGFYGDPRHGGNRDGVSWKMLGLPYPPIRGRQKYDLTQRL